MSLTDSIQQYYNEVLNPRFVTKELLTLLLAEPSPWDINNFYGMVAFYRTYSRWIPRLKRRECWAEVCLRVTEYSFSLLDNIGKAEDYIEEGEVEDFLLNLYRMNFLTSGRTLWRGDKNNPDATANYNCSFITLDNYQKYAEMVYLLMCGAGTGFSVEWKYVRDLEVLHPKVPITYEHTATTYKGMEHTNVTIRQDEVTLNRILTGIGKTGLLWEKMNNYDFRDNSYTVQIKVGDSRMGWATAVEAFFSALAYDVRPGHIYLDFSEIRPAGTPLKTMGGTASGHEVLKMAFKKVAWIIWNCAGVLDGVHAMDIANCLAEAIVAGGVRRSAQIALGDWDDEDFVTAKHNLYSGDNDIPPKLIEGMWNRDEYSLLVDEFNPKFRWQKSRVMSNNSVMIYDGIEKEELDEIFEYTKEFGEPGFINADVALQRFPGFKGVNPCAEILLDDRGLCNIGEIVLPRANATVNLWSSIESLVRHLLRITLAPLFMPEWTAVNQKYRLLGVGLCGITETIDKFFPSRMEDAQATANKVFDSLNSAAWSIAASYCKRLGISEPYNVTTIKPGGTLPQLPGVGSGMHRPYSPYFLHRIRVGVDHPINKVLIALGIQVDPEIGYEMENTPRYVYTIPCKADTQMRSLDEPALKQLERYKLLMDSYCDQNVSCTIQIDESEIADVKKWLIRNQESFVGISFFPKFDPDKMDTPMPLLPYETCTVEKYIPYQFTEEQFFSLFASLRDEQAEDEDESNQESCVTGFCPQR